MSGNPDNGPDNKTLEIVAAIGGSAIYNYSISANNPTHGNMHWLTKSFTFTAVNPTTDLSFISLTTAASGNPTYPQAFGPALDNVSMYAVPESSMLVTWSLLGSVAMVGVWWQKRRK